MATTSQYCKDQNLGGLPIQLTLKVIQSLRYMMYYSTIEFRNLLLKIRTGDPR